MQPPMHPVDPAQYGRNRPTGVPVLPPATAGPAEALGWSVPIQQPAFDVAGRDEPVK